MPNRTGVIPIRVVLLSAAFSREAAEHCYYIRACSTFTVPFKAHNPTHQSYLLTFVEQ